jgi:hypothetical protein
LAKVLFPVVTHEGRLRDALALVKIELAPLPGVSRAPWKEICQQSLDRLRRCVYLDKDLVLPVTGSVGLGETFLVAASTAPEGAETMMKRIREQLEAGPGFKTAGCLKLSATAVELPSHEDGRPLEALVQAVADRVTEMGMAAFASKPAPETTDGEVNAVQNQTTVN